MATDRLVTIQLPESLYDRVHAKIKGTKFRTVSEYVAYALREKLVGEDGQEPSYAAGEEERAKVRLKALGYL